MNAISPLSIQARSWILLVGSHDIYAYMSFSVLLAQDRQKQNGSGNEIGQSRIWSFPLTGHRSNFQDLVLIKQRQDSHREELMEGDIAALDGWWMREQFDDPISLPCLLRQDSL